MLIKLPIPFKPSQHKMDIVHNCLCLMLISQTNNEIRIFRFRSSASNMEITHSAMLFSKG